MKCLQKIIIIIIYLFSKAGHYKMAVK